MTYEELAIQYSDLKIKEVDFSEMDPEGEIEGLCIKDKIFIRNNLINSNEKVCILAEEIGHYHTTVGNILDQSRIENRKQELKARRWAVKRLVRVEQLVNAFNEGLRYKYEIAEYLGVTEEFLETALQHFLGIYGMFHKIDNYVICFDPLTITKSFDCDVDKQEY